MLHGTADRSRFLKRRISALAGFAVVYLIVPLAYLFIFNMATSELKNVYEFSGRVAGKLYVRLAKQMCH